MLWHINKKNKSGRRAGAAFPALAAGLLLLLGCAPAWAWTTDPVPVAPDPGVVQTYPRAVQDSQGGWYLVWQDYRNGNSDIFAQHLNKEGQIVWPAGGVTVCYDSANQVRPKVVPGQNGGITVLWRDNRNAEYQIYAQRVSSQGALVGGEIPLISTSSTLDAEFQALSDAAGGVVVLTQAPPMAERMAWDGTLQWGTTGGEEPLTLDNNSGGFNAKGCVTSDSGLLSVWKNSSGLYTQKISSDGNKLWNSALPVTLTSLSNPTSLEPLCNDAGGAAATWIREYYDGQYHRDLMLQQITSSGQAGLVPPRAAALEGIKLTDDYVNKAVALPDGKGGLVIGWFTEDTYDVKAQRFSSSGSPLWSNPVVMENTTDFELLVFLGVPDGQGGGVFMWPREDNSLHYQRARSTGALSWSSGAPALDPTTDYKTNLSLAGDGGNQALGTWFVTDPANYNAYAGRILYPAGSGAESLMILMK